MNLRARIRHHRDVVRTPKTDYGGFYTGVTPYNRVWSAFAMAVMMLLYLPVAVVRKLMGKKVW